jgi:hypothetical protein
MSYTYQLTCLICGYGRPGAILTSMQEHVMEAHGYLLEQLREQGRRQTEHGWTFSMPDGVEWLHAEKVEHETPNIRPTFACRKQEG